MGLLSRIRDTIDLVKENLKESSFDKLIWLVNLGPTIAGFSLRKDKISAPYWILHLGLLLYVYGGGSLMYQLKIAQGAKDFIKSYVNVSLFILIMNISCWWIGKRSILRKAITRMDESDRCARSGPFYDQYKRRIRIIKAIVVGFYTSQFIDALFIYIPHRVDVMNEYSMVPCVGLAPLDVSPNREICLTILLVQELTIMVTCLDYQALLVCLIAHTSAMYQMLSLEMFALNDKKTEDIRTVAKEKLPSLIYRHIIILEVTNYLKALYSLPIGVDFASNAVCICLFFYLSLEEWLMFIPVLVYCFLVFFLYCFLCQKMTNAAEEFERAVYSCGWENFDLKEKKMIFIMLWQAQKPIVLLAADIIPVNIYTFATTLQGLFKFVTVMKF